MMLISHHLEKGCCRLASLAVVLGLLLAVTGCNTMQGIGKDIEKAGEAIQKSTK